MRPAEGLKDLGVASHVAPLAAACALTVGPVLECGTGWWSTPLLHGMCSASKRELVSLETDPEWFSVMSTLYATPWHRFSLVENWPDRILRECGFGLAFVDCSPGDKRVDLIFDLKEKATVIVAHDVEADIPPSAGGYGWVKLEGAFKYEFIFKDVRPWTAVWSDVVDVRRLFS